MRQHVFAFGLRGVVGVIAVVMIWLGMTASAQAAPSMPVLGFTPQTGGTYDFGIVDVGSHADQAFTLTNSGGSGSGALAISFTGSSTFSTIGDTCSAGSLGPGKKCTLTVRYTPTGSGGDAATLTATSSRGATASLTLKGAGGVAHVEISPSWEDFGSVVGSQTFTATNNGNIPTATYSFNGPTDSHFSLIGTNSCDGSPLAPSGSCSFTVAFTPPANCATHPTLYQDTVSLASYASATVRGEQRQCLPHLVFSPCHAGTPQAACLFPFPPIGPDAPQTFTLSNDGDIPTGSLTFTFTNDPFGKFTLEAPTGSGDCQNVSTLAVGESCTVTIIWAGRPAGCTTGMTNETAELRVDDAAYNYPPPGYFGVGDAELWAWYDC